MNCDVSGPSIILQHNDAITVPRGREGVGTRLAAAWLVVDSRVDLAPVGIADNGQVTFDFATGIINGLRWGRARHTVLIQSLATS